MNEKVKYVEVTMKVPKNVVEALREFVLKHDTVTEQEFWTREAISVIVGDIKCVCADAKLDPIPIMEKYNLLRYYNDC